MRITHFVLALGLALSTQVVFAHDMMSDSKDCKAVASACVSAGFGGTDKFWEGCMMPVLLGQSVKGVSIDAAVVKTCRADKITQIKSDLKMLEHVSGK